MTNQEIDQAYDTLRQGDIDLISFGSFCPHYGEPHSTCDERTLVVNVKGPRGGKHRREYTSYAAFRRALPSLKRRNSTRTGRMR